MTHICTFSGGVGSFFATKRVVDKVRLKNNNDKIIALFADTLIEDEDLYRFLKDTINYLNIDLITLRDGRTPWQVFFDVKFLGNSRVDSCSKFLKRDLLNKWIRENYKPSECIVYLGIDWTEDHRIEKVVKKNYPYVYEAPLCDPPFIDKNQMLEDLEKVIGIKKPRLYDLGFFHNNCSGFCIKYGTAQFKLLLEKFPDRYRYHEEMEEKIRLFLNKDVTILRIQRNKKKVNITLKEFREHIESGGNFDKFDWGGCGCGV
jgi:hypothetical protein